MTSHNWYTTLHSFTTAAVHIFFEKIPARLDYKDVLKFGIQNYCRHSTPEALINYSWAILYNPCHPIHVNLSKHSLQACDSSKVIGYADS